MRKYILAFRQKMYAEVNCKSVQATNICEVHNQYAHNK